jgi:hypothetical protein
MQANTSATAPARAAAASVQRPAAVASAACAAGTVVAPVSARSTIRLARCAGGASRERGMQASHISTTSTVFP